MVDGNTNAIRVPIVAPVKASTNSTTITKIIQKLNQVNFLLAHSKPTTIVQMFSEKVSEECNGQL